jgi:hypothetical protein
MVRAAGQDGHRPVDLLGEHGADQGVRPGLHAEGEGLVGAGQDVGREAVGAADCQHDLAHAIVAQAGEAGGEGAGGMRLAVLVATDDVSVFQVLQQELALGGLAGLAAFQLDNLDRAETERTPGGGGALGIVPRQFGLGRAAQAADDEEGELQFATDRAGGSTDQIFSML